MKNNIYINELFDEETTFLGYLVCENKDSVATALLENKTFFLIENFEDIKKYNFDVLYKGKNAKIYEYLSGKENDEVIKKIYLYLSFALRRLEREKDYKDSAIIKKIYEVLHEKDRYIDQKYPEHKHYI